MSTKNTKYISLEQVFFSNLLLLGFEPELEQKKHGIGFHADMFKKPNEKGMQVVFYFLFMKISPRVAKEEFRSVWPCHDKRQQQDFKQIVDRKLSEFEKDGILPLNVYRKSMLQSCGGDKFYLLLVHVSNYALKETYRQLKPNTNVPTWNLHNLTKPHHVKLLTKTIMIHIAMQSQLFVDTLHQHHVVTQQCNQFNENLNEEYKKLQKELKEIQQQEEGIALQNLHNVPVDELSIEHIRREWNSLCTHFALNQYHREMISNILLGRQNLLRLDSHQLSFNIPFDIDGMEELQREISQDEKSNLGSLIKTWNACLKKLQNNISNIKDSDNPSLLDLPELIQTHKTHLNNLKEINAAIVEQLRHIQETIDTQSSSNAIKAPASFHTPEKDRRDDSSRKLQLIPPTPAQNVLPYSTPPSVMRSDVLNKLARSVKRVATAGPHSRAASVNLFMDSPHFTPRPPPTGRRLPINTPKTQTKKVARQINPVTPLQPPIVPNDAADDVEFLNLMQQAHNISLDQDNDLLGPLSASDLGSDSRGNILNFSLEDLVDGDELFT